MLRASATHNFDDEEPVMNKDPDDMNFEELKAYYDRGGANRMQNMT